MPQRPNTTGALGVALDSPTLTVGYILRMDIVGDPVFAWTGLGPLTFGAGATGDSALDGNTFDGASHLIADIASIDDGIGGTNGVEVRLPGMDLTDEAMRQVVYNRNRWQFQPAWLWMVFLDQYGAVIGNPVRLRSGRMDQMVVTEEDDGSATITCTIESQAAYASEASNTRYSEQGDIDATDNSQRYVWQLANMNPQTGQKFAIAGAGGAPGTGSVPGRPGGYGGGGGGGGRFGNMREL